MRYFYITQIMLLTLSLFGQADPSFQGFEHYSINDGLSQNTIVSMIQDSKGFIWMATQEGLNRFDGSDFKVYKGRLSQKYKFSNTLLLDLDESYSGNIIICYQNGIDIYNTSDNSITSFFYNPDDSELYNDLSCVSEVKIKNDWKIFIGSRYGINILDENTKKIKKFPYDSNNPNSLSSNMINDIFQDSKNNIWIGTNKGLNKFNPDEETFKCFLIDTINIEYNRVKTIFEDRSSNLWIGTSSGMYKFLKDRGEFISYKEEFRTKDNLSNLEINAICEDDEGNYYVGTPNGLNYIVSKEHRIIQYLYDNQNPNGISTNYIFSLLKTTDGNIWLGTYGGGINKINKYRKKFSNYTTDPYDVNSLNVPDVLRVYEDNEGILWIGTHGGGLNKYDIKANKFTHFLHDPNNSQSICNNYVRAICEDEYGKLWLGTDGGGISVFDKQTEKFNHFKNDPKDSLSLISDIIRDILEDQYGTIWITTYGNGLDRYDREKNCFMHYRHDSDNVKSLGSDFAYAIYEDRYNDLWITTNGGGLNKYNRQFDDFTVYFNGHGKEDKIGINWIYDICQDKNGKYIIASDVGLVIFDERDNTFNSFKDNLGILTSTLYSLLEDERGNIWVSSNNGISKFNPATNELFNYGIKEGVISKEFWGQSCFKNKKGEMFFGGINGLTVFSPNDILDEDFVVPVYLIDLKIFNKSLEVGEEISNRIILEKSIESTEKIILTHNEKSITFEFASINFINPLNTIYAYMLEGFDKDWNYTNNRRFISFTNLPPGNYALKVKASTDNGRSWSREQAKIKIKVLPPLWKNWWFRLLVLLILIGTIFYWYWIKLNQVRKQNFLLEQRVNERTEQIQVQKENIEKKNEELELQKKELIEVNNTKDKFFSIISHDLKSPFNSLLGFGEFLMDNLKTLPEKKVLVYLGQMFSLSKNLYNLMENLLEWSRSKRGIIKNYPRKLVLLDIFDNALSVSRISMYSKKIYLEVKVDKNTCVFADEILLSSIIRNLVSNAIKFSKENSVIIVSSHEKEKEVEVLVSDDGIGMNKDDLKKLFRDDIHFSTKGTNDERGTGLGLILCREFVEMNGGKIWVNSKQGKGTTFTFTLPKYIEQS